MTFGRMTTMASNKTVITMARESIIMATMSVMFASIKAIVAIIGFTTPIYAEVVVAVVKHVCVLGSFFSPQLESRYINFSVASHT